MARLCLAGWVIGAILALSTPSDAQRWGYTPQDFRHYPGRRYIAMEDARVHLRPDATSRIVYDLTRQRLVYAEATSDPNWLAIRGAGSRDYPDLYRGDGFARFHDGRILSPVRPDRDSYYPQAGFIRREALADIDAEEPALGRLEAFHFMPLPNDWANIGAQDDRYFVTRQTEAPFRSIGRLTHPSQPGDQTLCTGTFLASDRVFVTAGHCVLDKIRSGYQVRIQWTRSDLEVVDIHLVASVSDASSGHYKDWAVFRLARRPKHAIESATPFSAEDLEGRAGFQALSIGFPQDMWHVSPQLLGYHAPVVSACDLPARLIEARDFTGEVAIFVEHSCTIWWGNSGGPLFVWSRARQRWVFLAITSYGGIGGGGDASLSETFGRDSLKALEAAANAAMRKYELVLGRRNGATNGAIRLSSRDNLMVMSPVPGAAALGRVMMNAGYFSGRSGDMFSTRILDAIAAIGVDVPRLDTVKLLSGRSGITRPGRGWTDFQTLETLYNSIRGFCLSRCAEKIFDKHQQVTFTIGTVLTDAVLSAGSSLVLSADQLSGLNRDGRNAVLLRGGDAFVFNRETKRVIAVERRFMLLDNEDDALLRVSRGACGNCFDTPLGGAAPEPTTKTLEDSASPVVSTMELRTDNFGSRTPFEIPGARTIRPRSAFRMTRDPSLRPVVVTALSDPIGVPGAVQMPYAWAGGTFEDTIQQRLRTEVDKITGGDRARPIITYCHHRQCWLSYNIALRLSRAGYTNVYWMREGIAGWIADGLPVSFVEGASAAAAR